MLKEQSRLLRWRRLLDKELHADFATEVKDLVRAVREDDAKKCDEQAAFYRSLRDKGPKEYSKTIDMDSLRMMVAEACASALRRKR